MDRELRSSLALLALLLAASGPWRAARAEPATAPSAPTVCDCVTPATHEGRVCWGLSKAAFVENFGHEKTEVEGALRGRFFPDALAWAMRGADKSGHFLRVECGSDRKPCPAYRDVLERRLLVTAFLTAVPERVPATDLFDAATWSIKPPGLAVLKEAGRCRPGFWKEVRAAAGLPPGE